MADQERPDTTKDQAQAPQLWTRDFTIITLGSAVSMFGNALSGFAISLMVLDYSSSTFLYAIYMICYTAPQLIMPIVSGAFLDRFSRKKTIYSLDYLSAGLYALAALLLFLGWFNFGVFALFAFVVGSINSIYMVAYESFYPLLIAPENYSKAYSVASVLETMSAIMVPVSAFLYNQIGMAPLLAINAVCFFTAATMETRIRQEEVYMETHSLKKEYGYNDLPGALQDQAKVRYSPDIVLKDIKEGFLYLRGEKGLLAVAMYFLFSFFGMGCSNVLTLPYFKSTYENGEYVYIMVFALGVLGRMLGGMWHYRHKLPPSKKYTIALTVYLMLSLIEGVYLFLPIKLMMILFFFHGAGGITSYTIRISGTQNYVPDEKKGRFNGAFNMLSTSGMLLGELFGGALSVVLPVRAVIVITMVILALAAIFFIGRNREEVSKIYNM
ncbi:MAG: MFS transporter [Firmicutes bacterium]|nr:MFS transporter [Bacillota bacterium]